MLLHVDNGRKILCVEDQRVKRFLSGMTVIALVALAGCSKGSDNTMIVKVNESRITVGDIKKQVAGLPPETLQLIATDEKARKSVLDDIIAFELALQEAKRQGLANIEFNKRQAALRNEMERRIQEEGKNELVTSLLRKELAEKLTAKPTDAEVKEFYAKYKDKMVTADGRKVSLQEAASDIRDRLTSLKQRDAYLAYTNTLREKAKITINEDSLQVLASSLAKAPDQGGLFSQLPAPKKDTGKEPAAK